MVKVRRVRWRVERGTSAGFAGFLVPSAPPRIESAVCLQAYRAAGNQNAGGGAARYNPMSYHNGSIGHTIRQYGAAGISKYGGRLPVVHILSDIFEAASHFGMRLRSSIADFARCRQGQRHIR